MKKVFEPGEMELADPRGDPNRVIAIQTKVKELLEANRQRQEGIRSELLDEGAWALPGLLNATYVWMNSFEESKPARDIMASMLAELSKDNDSASSLLVDSGILENPFKTPREIVIQALDELQWKPSPEQVKKINTLIRDQEKSGDAESLLISYELLAHSGDIKVLNTMIKQCEKWSAEQMEVGPILLGRLIQYYPEAAEKILTNVIKATKNLYNERNLARGLIEAIRPIPPNWLFQSTILDISSNVLSECTPPRNTVIEYLWEGAVKDVWKKFDHDWGDKCKEINDMVFDFIEELDDEIAETISRYWFQAVKNTNNLDTLINAALSEFEPWGTSAALELFFLQTEHGKKHASNPTVEEALSKVRSENPDRYNRAKEKYDYIKNQRKSDSGLKGLSKNAGLTDR